MQENPIPIYIVEFMSQEWITWSLFSLVFIATPLLIARFLNKSQKKMVSYVMGGLLIMDFIVCERSKSCSEVSRYRFLLFSFWIFL